MRGYDWSRTLRIVASRKRPWLYEGVTMLTRGGSGISRGEPRPRRCQREREEDRDEKVGRRLLPDVDGDRADEREDSREAGGDERRAGGLGKHRRQQNRDPDKAQPDPDQPEVEDPGHVLIIDHARPDARREKPL